MIISVGQGQVLEDIAIQQYGTVEAVFILMEDNDLDLDSQLYTGQELVIREEVPALTDTNKEIARYYSEKKLYPNTGISNTEELELYVDADYLEEGYLE